jgi:diguanylate cyclase (GGDEF)-like protein
MTLNFRIFKLIGGLVTLSSLAILLIVWLAGVNQIAVQVAKDLQIGQNVIERVFENRSNLLFSTADVLTADFGFKQAVASRDRDTIESALSNHGERISADLMVLLSLQGETLASTADELQVGEMFSESELVQQAVEQGGVISMLSLEGRLYQIILLTVEAPAPIAVALVGFEINMKLIDDLTNITKLQVTILSDARQPASATRISSLSDHDIELAIAAQLSDAKTLNPFTYQAEKFVSHHFSMKGMQSTQGALDIILSERLGNWFSSFYRLLLDITLIGLLSMALAIFLGLVFSRNITRPLANLVHFARQIAAGEYRRREDAQKDAKTQEISRLEDAFFTMQEDIQRREQKIQYQASYDLLTGLFNRYEITELIRRLLEEKHTFDVLSFKILSFREVNNAFGYDCGDAILQSLGVRIQALGGQAARLNGSEILWLPEQPVSHQMLERHLQQLEVPHKVQGLEIKLKLAVGHLHLPQDANTVEALFRHLSIVIQKAEEKASFYQIYEAGMEEEYLRRLKILRELEQTLEQAGRAAATEHSELTMFYQPKLDLRNHCVSKVEALIRWNSSVLGFVPPDLFIPIAERAGLINELTQWVISRVVRDITHWRAEGIHLGAAINLSVHDLTHPPLVEHIRTLLEQNQLPASQLEFEVTESDLMNDPQKAMAQLHTLKEMGFSLAIDDFGTGYSSMAYLKNMPVNALKIDKSFVLKLHENHDDQTIVSVMIDLAKRFDLEVVAEGVENQAALDQLKAWGCDWAQGYHISRPVDNQSLMTFIQNYVAS